MEYRIDEETHTTEVFTRNVRMLEQLIKRYKAFETYPIMLNGKWREYGYTSACSFCQVYNPPDGDHLLQCWNCPLSLIAGDYQIIRKACACRDNTHVKLKHVIRNFNLHDVDTLTEAIKARREVLEDVLIRYQKLIPCDVKGEVDDKSC